MRVSRFTQASLMAIALFSAIGAGVLGGANFQGSNQAAISSPLELISQEFETNEDSETNLRRERPGQFLRSLNLSRRQKRQLFEIRDQYKADIRRNRQDLRSQTKQLRQLMISEASDTEVTAQFQNVQKSRQALNEANFKSYLEIREVLTLEQRKMFAEKLQARRQSRRR